MRRQKGFVLVSVLIITTITTMLAFSQISENRLQERIAGNQQKEISARLAAEKGVFDAFEDIDKRNKAEETNAQILAVLDAWPAHADYSFPSIELDASTFTLTLLSKGEVHGASAYLKAQIKASEEIGSSLFENAVTGCDGVIIGNGRVDSYDSTNGSYDVNNPGKNGGVATINSDGNIEFSSSATIEGNVISSGNISNSSSAVNISGDLTAVGDISLTGITTSGDIHSGGNLNMFGLQATGQNMTVGGDIITQQGKPNIINSEITYGGTAVGLEETASHQEYIVAPDVTRLGTCDPLDIPSVMTDLNTAMGKATATATDFSSLTGSILNFSEFSITLPDGSEVLPVTTLSLPEDSVSSGTSDIFGEVASVYIFGAADLTDQTINISGDITIIVQGGIITKDTEFVLQGKTSSLTILTTGQIDMNSNTTTVYSNPDVDGELSINEEGQVPLTIYSSYQSTTDTDLALITGSNVDIYAKVYAPLGNVSLTGGANIKGAVRGNKASISSATAIHYDEALADINDIIVQEAIPASYSSVYYYYPDE